MPFKITTNILNQLKSICDINGDDKLSSDNQNIKGLKVNEQSVFDTAKQALEKNGSCNIMGKRYEIYSSDSLQEIPTFDAYIARPDATRVDGIIRPVELEVVNKRHIEYKTIDKKISESCPLEYPAYELNDKVLSKAFNNVIQDLLKQGGKSKKSVLTDQAQSYINAGKEKGVNPIILMGITMIESGYGTSDLANNKNNVGGLLTKKNGRRCAVEYETVSDSIQGVARVVKNNINNKYTKTIRELGLNGNYCCSNRQHWVNSVVTFSELIRLEYNKLITAS